MTQKRTLNTIDTPSLILDIRKVNANINRLKDHLSPFNVSFRPHLKTSKCIEVARMMMSTPSGPATVSTLKEAEQFAAGGVTDILYAVGIAPGKYQRLAALAKSGTGTTVVMDSVAQARDLAAYCTASECEFGVLIEIDCDGHRSGVKPHDSATLTAIAGELAGTPAKLKGVMTHAGASYSESTSQALIECAEQERKAVAGAADILNEAGYPCEIVSAGSTPTAHFARDLTGVTEIRAGVFAFFDLVMAGIGVCQPEDIALSVLTTVIGHQKEKNWILVDAGWMAMSRDKGTSKQKVDQGYGVVCDIHGHIYEDLLMVDANQEHGILSLRSSKGTLPDLPVGTRLRILPNHACATAAQHPHYEVTEGEDLSVIHQWQRFYGW
ncbi:MAG: alanine racemase [Alteromonadaceae bacterium]|nr:alanine racemase [Alteromonadaceae bacterium]